MSDVLRSAEASEVDKGFKADAAPPDDLVGDSAESIFERIQKQVAGLPNLHKKPDEYIQAADRLEPLARAVAFAMFRRARDVATYDRINGWSDEQIRLDQIVVFVAAHRMDLMPELITASAAELARFSMLRSMSGDTLDISFVKPLVEQKQAAIRQTILDHMGPENGYAFSNDVVRHAADPESILACTDDEWNLISKLSPVWLVRLSRSKRPLNEAAMAIPVMLECGLGDGSTALLDSVASISAAGGSEERRRFCRAYLDALHSTGLEPTNDPYSLHRFRDPLQVVSLARMLDGTPDIQIKNMCTILGYPETDELPQGTDQAAIESFKAFVPIFRGKNIPPSVYQNCMHVSEDERSELLKLLSSAEFSSLEPADVAYDVVLRSSDRIGCAYELLFHKDRIMAIEEDLRVLLILFIGYGHPHLKRAVSFFFNEYDKAQREEPYGVGTRMRKVIDFLLTPGNLPRIVNIAEAFVLDREIEAAFFAKGERDMTLDDHPELQRRLQNLGLPNELTVRFFNAWKSYSVQTQMEAGLSGKTSLENKSRSILNQFYAVKEFIDIYGVDECVQVVETFRILNFARGTHERIHNQLLRWNEGTDVPKTVGVYAHISNNVALSNGLNELFDLFGEEGTFYFEAGSELEISQTMVMVGERDRRNGRDPLQNPTVENVVICGHGTPTLVELDYGQTLSKEAYAKAVKGIYALNRSTRPGQAPQASSNTYARHLGNRFRTILFSCSVGGLTQWGPNLVNTMGVTHKSDTYGGVDIITGIRIDPDNNIIFLSGDRVVESNVNLAGTRRLERENSR